MMKLRGKRKTFEDCNAVRVACEGMGVLFCEEDRSMNQVFKEELRKLLKRNKREREREELTHEIWAY